MTTLASTMFETSVPVVILKIGSYPLQHSGVGIARSLGRVGVPVYGVCEDRFSPGGVSRYVRGRFLWRNDLISSGEFLAGMEEIAYRIGRRSIVIPTDDRGAILLAEHAGALTDVFSFPAVPSNLPRTLASKKGLFGLCRDLGVPCPEAVFPETSDDVERFLTSAEFPIIAKTIDHWSLGKDAPLRSTMIVASPDDVRKTFARAQSAGAALMFQEYIPDEHAEDWIFHGYCDGAADPIVGFTGIKLRSYPPHAGPTTLGRTVANPELHGQACRLVKAIGYRGIMDLDYRFDRRDRRYKLLDFNPRIGAQFRLFENDAGTDVARALHLDLTSRAVPRSDPVEGRRFVVEHYDAIAAWSYMKSHELSFAGWLRSVLGVEAAAWFARDDLRPFVFMSIRLVLTAIWRSTWSLWGRPSSSALSADQPGHWARPRYVHNRGGRRSRARSRSGAL
jgi:predicted ATP-grasp superfamily ATP-dependent carboligase